MTISATNTYTRNNNQLGGMMKAFALFVKCAVLSAIVVPVVRAIGLDVIVNGLSRVFQIAVLVLTHAKWNELFVLSGSASVADAGNAAASLSASSVSISGIDPFVGLALLGFFAMAVLFGVVVFATRGNEA